MLHAKMPISKAVGRKLTFTCAVILAIFFAAFFTYAEKIASLGFHEKTAAFSFCYILAVFFISVASKKILRKNIGEPLNKLSAVTDEVISGNYSAKADATPENEVGSLARNLNFMIDIITRHTNELEEKIELQTGEIGKISAREKNLGKKLAELKEISNEYESLLSKDFKTHSTAALNYSESFLAQFVEEEFPNKKYYIEQLAFISYCSRQFFNDILTAGCFENAEISIRSQKCNFIELIEKALYFFRPSIECKKLAIKKDFSSELSTTFIDADKMLLVLNNLISNAVKFSPVNGVINIRSLFEGENIFFSISDEGAGITNENQQKIFTEKKYPAAPVSSGTAGESGFGIGLRLAKLFIEAHGGLFWFESKPGHGSIFNFKITQKALD